MSAGPRKGYTPLELRRVTSKADRQARGYAEDQAKLAAAGAVLQPPKTIAQRPSVRRRLSLNTDAEELAAASTKYNHLIQSIETDSPPALEQSTQALEDAAAEAETQPPPDLDLYDEDAEEVTFVKETPPRVPRVAIPATPEKEDAESEAVPMGDGDGDGDDGGNEKSEPQSSESVMIVDTPVRKERERAEETKLRSSEKEAEERRRGALLKNLKSFMSFHKLERWVTLEFSPNGRYVVDKDSDRQHPIAVYDLKGPNVYPVKRIWPKERIWGFGNDSTLLISYQYEGKDKFISEDVVLVDFVADKVVFHHEVRVAPGTAIERIRCNSKGHIAIQYMKTTHTSTTQRTLQAIDLIDTVVGKAETSVYAHRQEMVGFKGTMLVVFTVIGLFEMYVSDAHLNHPTGLISALSEDDLMSYEDIVIRTHELFYLNKIGQVVTAGWHDEEALVLKGGLPYPTGSLKRIGTRLVAFGQGTIEPFVVELDDRAKSSDHILLHTPQFVAEPVAEPSISVSLSPPLEAVPPPSLVDPKPVPATVFSVPDESEPHMEEDSLPPASIYGDGATVAVPRSDDPTSARMDSDLVILARHTPGQLDNVVLRSAPVNPSATLELARIIRKSRMWSITLHGTKSSIVLHPQFLIEVGKANRMFGVLLNERDPAPFYQLLANMNAVRRLGWVEFIRPREVSASSNTIHYGRCPILVLKDVRSIELDRIHIFDSTVALYVTMEKDSFNLSTTLLDRLKMLKPRLKWFYVRARGEAYWTTGVWKSDYEKQPEPDDAKMYQDLWNKRDTFWTLEPMPRSVRVDEVKQPVTPPRALVPEPKASVLYPELLPYVPTLKDANVRVANSTLPIKGKGLFVTRDFAAPPKSGVGQVIIPYLGEILDAKALAERYPQGFAKYVLRLNSNKFVDAAYQAKSGLGRYANTLTTENQENGFRYNAEFTEAGNIRATRYIMSGSEVFCPYSSSYRLNGDDGSATAGSGGSSGAASSSAAAAASSDASVSTPAVFDLATRPDKYGAAGSPYDNRWTPDQITNRRLAAVKEISDLQGAFSMEKPIDLLMCSLDTWFGFGMCDRHQLEVAYEDGLRDAWDFQMNLDDDRVRIVVSRDVMRDERPVFIFGVHTLTRYDRLAVILLAALAFVDGQLSKRLEVEYSRVGVFQLGLDGLAAVGAPFTVKGDPSRYHSVLAVREGVYGWDGKEFKLIPYDSIGSREKVDAKQAEIIRGRLAELKTKHPVGSVVMRDGVFMKIEKYEDVFAVLRKQDKPTLQVAVWALK